MPATPPLLALGNGLNFAQGGFQFGAPRLSIDIGPFAILTAGAGANVVVQTIVLPPNLGDYVLESIELGASVAAGTLVAATFDLKANAVSLLTAPIALVGITAANLSLITAGPATRTIQKGSTTPAVLTLVISQTVNSANAGTVVGRIHLMVLPS